MAKKQKLPGEDTEAFKKLKKLKKLREDEGYKGPLDQNGNKVTSGPAYDALMALRDRT